VGALHVPESKKNAVREGAIIVFADEASFRQSPTLHQTWAPQNRRPEIPTRGERKTQKVLGAISLQGARFAYRHQLEYFDQDTYRSFLEEIVMPAYYRRGHRVYLIQDNASYHKAPEVWDWFGEQRRRLEVFLLPKYSPEFNAQERVWQYTRRAATHNRYFAQPEELRSSLIGTFGDMQRHPEKLAGFLEPFF
jgi:transposase